MYRASFIIFHYSQRMNNYIIKVYSMIQKDGLSFVCLYFLNCTWYVNDLYNIWKRRYTTARALAYHTAVQQRQLRATWLLCSTRFFAFVSSLKPSQRLLCGVCFIFVSTFNLRGTAFVVGITNLSKYAVHVKARAPANREYQRRKRDKFKRVLSVAQAS